MKNIQRRVWWSSFWTKFSSAFSASPTCIEDSCVRRPRDELSDSFSWQTDLWRDFDSKWPPWITRADRQVADGWSASTPASPPPSRSQMPYLCGDHLHGSNPNAISARMLAVSATSHHSSNEKFLPHVVSHGFGPVKCHHVSLCRGFTFWGCGVVLPKQITSFKKALFFESGTLSPCHHFSCSLPSRFSQHCSSVALHRKGSEVCLFPFLYFHRMTSGAERRNAWQLSPRLWSWLSEMQLLLKCSTGARRQEKTQEWHYYYFFESGYTHGFCTR